MKLLPFDLEKAQAGHPWGDEYGVEGDVIFDTKRRGCDRLITLFKDGSQGNYSINGESWVQGHTGIRLYEETKKRWVVIYRDETSPFGFSTTRCVTQSDKETYEKMHKNGGTYLKTAEVEY